MASNGWPTFAGSHSAGQAFGMRVTSSSVLCARWSDDLTSFPSAGAIFQSTAFARINGTDYGFLNGIQQQSKTSVGANTSTSPLRMGSIPNETQGPLSGFLSLVMVFSVGVDNSNQIKLNTLVRNTLCAGL